MPSALGSLNPYDLPYASSKVFDEGDMPVPVRSKRRSRLQHDRAANGLQRSLKKTLGLRK